MLNRAANHRRNRELSCAVARSSDASLAAFMRLSYGTSGITSIFLMVFSGDRFAATIWEIARPDKKHHVGRFHWSGVPDVIISTFSYLNS